ncbi:hypothetical protein PBV88_56255, partial [Streptomyces sp. T21Q-yed]|nr:hypothetical protein [Streptomyces sp. T21Q-yed]
SDENAQPQVSRASLDTPRGHDEDPAQTSRMPRIDDLQGPGSTTEIPAIGRPDGRQGPGSNAGPSDFARPDFDAPAPGAYNPQNTGQFVRSDVFGAPNGQNNSSQTGQFASPQAYDGSSTGQHALPGRQNPEPTGQFERPQVNGTYGGGSDFGAPQPPVPPRPQQ